MKKCWIRLKEIGKNIAHSINENGKTVAIYCFLGLLTVFGTLLFTQSLENAKERFKSDRNQMILLMENDKLRDVAREQKISIELGTALINKQSQQLKGADRLIQMQHEALDRLMRHLKSLDEWPPELEPVDPNRITEEI